jgi:nucleotide-binding universal stress UspA family protein
MVDVVVGTDLSPGGQAALRWAIDEARRRDVSVRAVLAWSFDGWSVDGCPRQVLRHAESSAPDHIQAAATELLHTAVEEVRDGAEQPAVVERAVHADPVDALLDEARGARMLVVGRRGAGHLRRIVVGSVSDACMHRAPGTVVIVPPEPTGADRSAPAAGDTRPVLVGVDGSAGSVHALRWAATAAALRAVPLRVVHAWTPLPSIYAGYYAYTPEENTAVEKAARAVLDGVVAKGVAGCGDVTVDAGLVAGSAAASLIREAAAAQLLVVGARGHEGLAELLLGSTSHRCAHHAPCPVVVIHGDIEG